MGENYLEFPRNKVFSISPILHSIQLGKEIFIHGCFSPNFFLSEYEVMLGNTGLEPEDLGLSPRLTYVTTASY